MIRHLIVAALFVATAADAVNIRHLQLDDAHLFDTTPNNYAIISDALGGQKAVSVNDQSVTYVGQNCQAETKSLQSLTSQQQQQIQQAKSNFGAFESGNLDGYSRWASWDFKPANNMMFSGSNVASQSSIINNVRITRTDDVNYSVGKADWPNNMIHIFVTNDIATIVYKDNLVLAKPMTCLTEQEKQALAPYAPSSPSSSEYDSDADSDESSNSYEIPSIPVNPFQGQQNQNLSQKVAMLEAQVAQLTSQLTRLLQDRSGNNPYNGQQSIVPPLPPMPPHHHHNHHNHHHHHPPPPPPPPPSPNSSPFGNNWPFGNENNPFGPGFPWSG